MKTLRERLSAPGKKVIDLQDAPSYIHNFDAHVVADPNEDTLIIEWTDEGLDFSHEFALDEECPEVCVWLLTQVK